MIYMTSLLTTFILALAVVKQSQVTASLRALAVIRAKEVTTGKTGC
jgi:hypothetical protein